MLPKGQTKITISRATEERIKRVRRMMFVEHPEKYDENTSYHQVIIWLLDGVKIHV